MKRILLTLCVVLLATSAFAQMEQRPVKLRPLAIFEEGFAPDYGVAVGVNLNIFRDTASGFIFYTDQGAFFSHRDVPEEREGAYLIEYSGIAKPDIFGSKVDAYAAIGLGNLHLIRDGDNLNYTVVALDMGLGLSGVASIGAFGWYTPGNDGLTTGLTLSLKPWF